MADAGGFDGFAAPSNITPELEHWFAQISAEMQKAAVGIGNIAANTDDLLQYNGTDWVAVADINADSIAAGTFGSGAYTFTGGDLTVEAAIVLARSAGGYFVLRDSGSVSDTDMVSYISLQDSASAEKGWIGFGSAANTDLTIRNGITNGHIVLSADGASADVIFTVAGVDRYTFTDTSFVLTEPIYSTISANEILLDWGGTGASYIKKITDQGGILINADSSLFINAGDTGDALVAALGIVAGSTVENLVLGADNEIYLYPGQQSGFASGTRMRLSTYGSQEMSYLGTAALPTFSWADDNNTGVYRYFGDNVGISGGGTHIAHFDSALGMVVYPGMYAVNGTAGTYRHAAWSCSSLVTANLKYVSGSVAVASSYQYIDAAGGSDAGGVVFNAFANGTGRGFYAMVAPTSLGAASTVTTLDYIIAVDSNGMRSSSGATATPGYAFLDDVDTGMYLGAVGSLGFSVGNGLRMTINTTAVIMGSGMRLSHNNSSTRDKIRVWDSNLYAIGMGSNYTFGALADYAMTFQMNGTLGRGWWWGIDSNSDAQGAMSLTNIGQLVVASSIRAGFGTSDTTSPAYNLEINGTSQLYGSADNVLRLDRASATGSPYISWHQTGTRQMYMQYINGGTGRINVEGSSTYVFEILTGGVRRFKIDGLDADEGRVYAENAQMYGGYINSGTGTGATTVDFDRGNTHHLNNTGSRTMTISGAVNGTTGIITVESNTGATASWTWSTNIEWVGGSAPTLSTTVGHRDVIMLIYSDNAWLGSYTIGHV